MSQFIFICSILNATGSIVLLSIEYPNSINTNEFAALISGLFGGVFLQCLITVISGRDQSSWPCPKSMLEQSNNTLHIVTMGTSSDKMLCPAHQCRSLIWNVACMQPGLFYFIYLFWLFYFTNMSCRESYAIQFLIKINDAYCCTTC